LLETDESQSSDFIIDVDKILEGEKEKEIEIKKKIF
jgi:hypothetical protein